MPEPPAHIAGRRAQRRTQRRRHRIMALGGALVILAAGLAVALEALGSSRGPSAARAPVLARSHRRQLTRRQRELRAFAAVETRGSATIARLAALGLPLYCAGAGGRSLAFTFDDGPGPYTATVLHKLAKHHERATFFVVGTSIDGFPGYLPRELKMAAIGDHTYNHPVMTALSPGEVTSELQRTATLIHAQTGERVDLWRPPYGAHNATVDGIASRLGLLEVLWSVDSQDSLGANYAAIIRNVEAGMRPGAIILMHENHGQTIRALTTLLPELRRRHLRSVSLPELLATDPPSVSRMRAGWSACGLSHAPGGSGA